MPAAERPPTCGNATLPGPWAPPRAVLLDLAELRMVGIADEAPDRMGLAAARRHAPSRLSPRRRSTASPVKMSS